MDMGGANDAELQEFVAMEASKAKLQEQVHKLNSTCWDMCVDKPRDKLDNRSETCIKNCVERFIDTAKFIEGRFQQRIQKAASGGY